MSSRVFAATNQAQVVKTAEHQDCCISSAQSGHLISLYTCRTYDVCHPWRRISDFDSRLLFLGASDSHREVNRDDYHRHHHHHRVRSLCYARANAVDKRRFILTTISCAVRQRVLHLYKSRGIGPHLDQSQTLRDLRLATTRSK